MISSRASSSNGENVKGEAGLLQETFADPFEAVPAAEEYEAADVLVEGEDEPHRYEAPAEGDSENVASDHLYAPHDDDAYDYREIDVSSTSEGVDAEEVECTSVFEEDLNPEDRRTCRNDPWIGCEHGQNGLSEDGHYK